MGDFTKRDVLTIIIGMIVAGVLTVWATVTAINYFAPRNPDDPLTKAGGLRPEQTSIQTK
jgi:hypothetical protein